MSGFLPILADAGSSTAEQVNKLLTQMGIGPDQQHTFAGNLGRVALQMYFDFRLPFFVLIMVIGLLVFFIDGIILGAFDRSGERRKHAARLAVDTVIFGAIFLIFPYILPAVKSIVDYLSTVASSGQS